MVCEALAAVVLEVAFCCLIVGFVLVLLHDDLDLADHVFFVDFFAVVAEFGQFSLWEKLSDGFLLENLINHVAVNHQFLQLLQQFAVILALPVRIRRINRLLRLLLGVDSLGSERFLEAVWLVGEDVVGVARVPGDEDVLHGGGRAFK